MFKLINKLNPFKKKKKEKTIKADYKETDLKNLSSNKILIKVYKNFGSNTNFLKIKYQATEKRDIYNNLISINEEFHHNEDTDFTMDEVYNKMQIILEFKNKDKEKKLEILDEKIDKQDKLVKYLEKFSDLNAIYNYADEALKAKDYKLLRNYIDNHDKQGSYFTIEDGMRVYSFKAIDGFLIPIWNGIDTYTANPDHTRKMKVNIQEDAKMRQEMQQYNKEKTIGKLLTVGIIFNIILFCILMFTGFQVWQEHNNLQEKVGASAFQCAEYTSRVNHELTLILENTVIKQLLDQSLKPKEKEIVKEEKPIDPTKVLKVLE